LAIAPSFALVDAKVVCRGEQYLSASNPRRANAVYNAYPMVDKQEESTRLRADSTYEATNWSARIAVVVVPVVSLVA
jgi:hypothetical protein